ncbi:MAG: biopolymer transporter ExbD [Gammaproteobacteria bacterium]|nr:MAG: biopolymer transporter ExbD [Gammaproteobacteria bacterium]
MALGRRKITDEPAEIDMTPMLDVVFILLIFFVVTATFVRETGIGLQQTVQTEQPPPKELQLATQTFQIAEDNSVWLEGRRIDIRSVRANVERAHAENPRLQVVIEAHPKARTASFVIISDQAREAGVNDIALTTLP